MNKNLSYSPTECTMKSCAFPTARCFECLCNKSLFGKKAIKLKYPQSNYTFIRLIVSKQSAAYEK